jgi:hypothetical protein
MLFTEEENSLFDDWEALARWVEEYEPSFSVAVVKHSENKRFVKKLKVEGPS